MPSPEKGGRVATDQARDLRASKDQAAPPQAAQQIGRERVRIDPAAAQAGEHGLDVLPLHARERQ